MTAAEPLIMLYQLCNEPITSDTKMDFIYNISSERWSNEIPIYICLTAVKKNQSLVGVKNLDFLIVTNL